jgi:hypothetical protein
MSFRETGPPIAILAVFFCIDRPAEVAALRRGLAVRAA